MGANEKQTSQVGARSVVYHALSALFQHPDRHWLDALAQSDVFEALAEALGALRAVSLVPIARRVEAEFRQAVESAEALSSTHVRLFGLHGPVNCPPYATEFGQRHVFSKAQDLADISGFYRAFGLQLPDLCADRPDHISLLFEFLSYLALKQAAAIDEGNREGLAVCQDAEKKFFSQYVANWVPVFCDLLSDRSSFGFYRALAELTGRFVVWDQRRLGVRVELLSLPRRVPEADQERCTTCAQTTE